MKDIDISKAPGRAKGLRKIARVLNSVCAMALWPIQGELAQTRFNDPAKDSPPCKNCGKRWDQHIGKGPCPWWQV